MNRSLSLILFNLFLAVNLHAQNRNVTLNEQKQSSMFYHVGMQKPKAEFNYKQIAQKFKLYDGSASLNSLTIYRQILDYPIAVAKRFHKTTFKVHVYTINKISGEPGDELTPKNLEIKDERSLKILGSTISK